MKRVGRREQRNNSDQVNLSFHWELEERHNLSFANCGAENPMSSSSSRGGGGGDSGTRYLWYQYKICNCGKNVIVKIVDSEKPSKGCCILYAKKMSVGFSLGVTQYLERNKVGKEKNGRWDAGFGFRMHKLEEDLKSLKICVLGCIVVVTVLTLC
ncbi:hypothetical protein ACH5RR_024343 [Cinchona calisaya]|uniref:Uncharacterized protein n=1 Tax=Cinchona calisaya TaxID=153742 RepID=A0ABD2YWD5_9GENT